MQNPMAPLSDIEYESLRSSIAEDGVITPIVIDEDGNIIDGHNRQKIADELGISCPTKTVSGLDEDGKFKLAISLNGIRRQLTSAAKRKLAATMHARGIPKTEIAQALSVDRTTVGRWLNPPTSIKRHKGDAYASLASGEPATGTDSRGREWKYEDGVLTVRIGLHPEEMRNWLARADGKLNLWLYEIASEEIDAGGQHEVDFGSLL